MDQQKDILVSEVDQLAYKKKIFL